VSLFGRELLWVRFRARGNVVELALLLALPIVIPRLRQAQDQQRRPKREHVPRTIDGAQDQSLFLAVWNTSTAKRTFENFDQDDEKSQNREESRVAFPEFDNFFSELALRHRRDVEGNDLR